MVPAVLATGAVFSSVHNTVKHGKYMPGNPKH